jgi:hypothetical protein
MLRADKAHSVFQDQVEHPVQLQAGGQGDVDHVQSAELGCHPPQPVGLVQGRSRQVGQRFQKHCIPFIERSVG